LKKILIIYPHFPPSNLAGVHRPRLFAQHLPSFGWEPIIISVREKYYEEQPDWNLVKLLPRDLRIEKVNAYRNSKPRIIGDIGLRAFFQLYKRAKQIVISEKVDFLYIPIPSFYCALLGRWLHSSTGIEYGIDYIDPWVHHFPGSNKTFSRHWFSTQLAKFLEPIAIKKASLITGVAEGYYKAVLERNPELRSKVVSGAMPYGGEKADHEILQELHIAPYLFQKNNKLQMVYAGAMLPKAYEPLEAIFKCINANKQEFENVEFHFIGTGKTPDDAEGYNIKPLAERYGLWNTIVYEYPKRIPYLDVLVHLNVSDGIFILGSTEPHYTPSKIYQGVLSGKPLFAVLHKESTAVEVIRNSGAGFVLDFNGKKEVKTITGKFTDSFSAFCSFRNSFDPALVNMEIFEKYSAKNVTKQLVDLLNKVIQKPKSK
jgi:hypothetical protein